MRARFFLPALFLLTACGQGVAPAATSPEAIRLAEASRATIVTPPAEGLPRISSPLGGEFFIGIWSLSRNCAIDGTMGIWPNGRFFSYKWGDGTWMVDAEGRLVISIYTATPAGDLAASPLYTMTLTRTESDGDNLVGTLVSIRPDMPVLKINATECAVE